MRVFSHSRSEQQRGFSLVEVALAVAILSIALVALMGLLPSGISNFQTAMDNSIAAHISQRVMQDAQQAEFDVLVDRKNLPPDPAKTGYCPEQFSFRAPTVQNPGWRYFDEQGSEVRPKAKDGELSEKEKISVVYHVNTRIRPRAELPTINDTGGEVAQITVQIARNPYHQELPILTVDGSPDNNLFAPSVRVPVFTYSGLVGKNQGQ